MITSPLDGSSSPAAAARVAAGASDTRGDGPATLRTILKDAFGYSEFRPGQQRAMASVMASRDTLVVLPTGGGKSLCFQVPALLLPGLTVVVSPLISLMKDQVDALEAPIPAAFINSTLSYADVADRFAHAERGELRLLYMAPERFDAGSAADRLCAAGVSLLAVNKAHCISEWGHDSRRPTAGCARSARRWETRRQWH